MTDQFNPAAITWQAFGLFLRVRAMDRGVTNRQIAAAAKVAVGVVRRASGNRNIASGNFTALCRWMGEPESVFAIDPETGICVSRPAASNEALA